MNYTRAETDHASAHPDFKKENNKPRDNLKKRMDINDEHSHLDPKGLDFMS